MDRAAPSVRLGLEPLALEVEQVRDGVENLSDLGVGRHRRLCVQVELAQIAGLPSNAAAGIDPIRRIDPLEPHLPVNRLRDLVVAPHVEDRPRPGGQGLGRGCRGHLSPQPASRNPGSV